MPSITQFAQDSEDAVIRVRDIEINVTYNASRVSVRHFKELAQIERTLDFGAAARFLDHLLDAWDVTGPLEGENEDGETVELVGKGEPIPFTEECLEALGFIFVTEFLDVLQDEVIEGPNPTAATRRSRKRSRGRG